MEKLRVGSMKRVTQIPPFSPRISADRSLKGNNRNYMTVSSEEDSAYGSPLLFSPANINKCEDNRHKLLIGHTPERE